MGSISLNRLGGIALVAGPVLAIVFFLLQPGGVLIDSADTTDAEASITALASNTALVDVTAILISLGLVLMVYGFYAVQDVTRDGDGDALSRFGLLLIVVGAFGWVLAQGLTLVLAHADLQDAGALGVMLPVYEIESGITLISAMAVSLGILTFSLALSTRDDFNRIAALVIAAVSVVALVCFIIAATVPAQTDTMITIGRVAYFPWVIWTVMLGVGLVKRDVAEE
jgi:hypothetical protein